MGRVILFFIFYFSPKKQRGTEGEGLPDFFFFFSFPVQQTTSGIGHRVSNIIYWWFLSDILLFTRAPSLVLWFDGTIIVHYY